MQEMGGAGLARERVEQAMRQVTDEILGPAGQRQVLGFAPGTRPSTDNRLLFFAVPQERVAAFEAAYAAGQPLDAYITQGVHVLPPTAAGDGVALYGVELPGARIPQKAYTVEAKTVRRALAGKPVKLESYQSEVALPARTVAEGRYGPRLNSPPAHSRG
jgi:hypothetical protein